jgi:Zn-dependent metalloprotease
MACLCSIVPPFLLEGIANSKSNTEEIRAEAQVSLEHHRRLTAHRHHRSAVHAQQRLTGQASQSPPEQPTQQTNAFIPQDILKNVSDSSRVDQTPPVSAKQDPTLQAPQIWPGQPAAVTTKDAPTRFVYNAQNTLTDAGLPGTLVREDGQPQAGDSAINQAFDNIGLVIQFYRDVFGWKSLDNQNGDVVGCVHVGNHLQNAYWNGTQMLFGDGGNFIYNFTSCLDVIAHELTHAITAHTTALVYEGESGALNEHLSDVFGMMVKQRAANSTVDKSDWLIGEGCLLPGVKGVAVRSMKDPGSAYDDPHFVSVDFPLPRHLPPPPPSFHPPTQSG